MLPHFRNNSGVQSRMQGMRRIIKPLVMAIVTALLTAVRSAAAAEAPPQSLTQLSDAFQQLVEQVAPSVVQVIVTAYTTVDRGRSNQTDLVMGRQRSIGSGVIVDSSGYIITNAHVVEGARTVQVVLPARHPSGGGAGVWSQLGAAGQTMDAQVVGATHELDLALLKIDAHGLQPMPLADYSELKQGELVFAFGSPEGFRDSVSMGLVSATARQPDPDTPIVYIQTDAAINHGNSGGPLVNARGQLVGINTFIVSNSGGSEGLGFAVPSALVAMAYPKLRDFGRLHRGEAGMLLQTITPELAAGLHLSRQHGVVVADVIPGKPAAEAGLQIGDVIDTLDGAPIDNVLPFAMRLFVSDGTEHLKVGGVRGDEPFSVDVALVPRPADLHRLTDLLDPDTSAVPSLGILALEITPDIADWLPSLRATYGVIVAARVGPPPTVDVALSTGDVIHSVNGAAISTVGELRSRLEAVRPRSPIVLQIERNGQLSFVTFDAE